MEGKTKFCLHANGCAHDAIRSLIRAFLLSSSLKLSLSFCQFSIPCYVEVRNEEKTNNLKLNLFARFQKVILKIKNKILSKKSLSDNLGFISFFTLWVFSYKSLLCIFRRIFINQNQQKMNSFLAGFLSGMMIYFEQNQTRKLELSFYFFARTLSILLQKIHSTITFNISKNQPQKSNLLISTFNVIDKTNFFPVLLFCLFAGITQYTFCYEPILMRKQYYQFIDELAKDPQGRLDKFLLYIRSIQNTKIPEGFELMERSLSHTDYYYTKSYFAPDPEGYITDDIKPCMNIITPPQRSEPQNGENNNNNQDKDNE